MKPTGYKNAEVIRLTSFCFLLLNFFHRKTETKRLIKNHYTKQGVWIKFRWHLVKKLKSFSVRNEKICTSKLFQRSQIASEMMQKERKKQHQIGVLVEHNTFTTENRFNNNPEGRAD